MLVCLILSSIYNLLIPLIEDLSRIHREEHKCHDTDLGSYSYFCGKLRHEFVRLCEEGMRLARKYKREDILQEKKPKHMLELYFEHTREERDLNRHLY